MTLSAEELDIVSDDLAGAVHFAFLVLIAAVLHSLLEVVGSPFLT
jgi:hypothetical protein